MTGAVAPEPPTLLFRAIAGVTLAFLAALAWLQPPWLARLQAAWFDSMQAVAPRPIRSLPVTIVAIDDRSLAALGQWPWPRTLLADLIRANDGYHPAAIGLDVLLPEPDRLSPERLVATARPRDAALADSLAALPSNDSVLAGAVAAAHVVLVVAGAAEKGSGTLRAVPVVVSGPAGAVGPMRYAGVVSNVEAVDAAGAGHGVISVEPARSAV